MINGAPLSTAICALIFVAHSYNYIAYSHDWHEANICLTCTSGFVLDGNPFDVAGIFDSYEVNDSFQDSFDAFGAFI
jgi:hypothetical protein